MEHIGFEGRLLLEGRSVFGSRVLLYETEDQFILVIGNEFMVSLNYDFDYRGMVDRLEEELDVIDWCDMDFGQYVEDWIAVECECPALDEMAQAYYRGLNR